MPGFIVKAIILLALPYLLDAQDLQNRSTLHLIADITDRWYVALWPIANIRAQSPSNFNIFAGAGRRGKNWYLEAMAQKQWNGKGGLWTLDFRYRRQVTGRLSVYAEPDVFLSRRAFYEFIIVEYRSWRKFNLGGETENVHQLGKDVLAAGPRISRPLGRLWGTDFALGLAYRTASPGHNEIRIYLNATKRFALTDRK
ncbi:MAG: hypothetical protein HY396_01680 [Candidatus Doudnabacteria bacterium]|nr:hypothetical protein [Candidatus Doudnabacteria bacterium]